MNKLLLLGLTLVGLCMVAANAWAAPLLSPSDVIIAIDTDSSASRYPAPNETPAKVLDGLSGTKYLNFAEENSGFIVTPVFGPSIIQSFTLTTANDSEERDPATWALYGTNGPIVSTDNSNGDLEPWTAIASGSANLPATRQTIGPVVSFANSASFTSYRMVFPTVKNAAAANSMQVADVALFQSSDGSGSNVLAVGDPILAIDLDHVFTSSYPSPNETPQKVIDGVVGTKYLNFGKVNSGFIVTPSIGKSIVKQFQITTANDAVERDPTGWALYGTNDPVASPDNSWGTAESWTLIATGTVDLPLERGALGPMVDVANDVEYKAYKMIFTSLRNAGATNSMQIDEVQFFGVPEPSSLALVLCGLMGLGMIAYRRWRGV